MTVKLAAALPKGSANGIASRADDLADGLGDSYVIVGIAHVSQVTQDYETEESIPTIKLRAVEVFDRDSPEGTELARKLREGYEARTGNFSLSLEYHSDDSEET